MRLASIRLTDFKRFKDLKISGLLPTHRFVFVLGPNGSGKSSLFEGFNVCRSAANKKPGFNRLYYIKSEDDGINWNQSQYAQEQQNWTDALRKVNILFFGKPQPSWAPADSWEAEAFQIRGARRTTADHSSDQIQSRFHVESQRPESTVLLSKDERLDRNYQRLVHSIQQTYLNPSGSTDHEVATEALKLLRQLQASTTAVFPDLRLEGLGDPTSQGTFLFSKRNGTKWRYVNLSSGEKSAFDLLVDLVLTAARVSETIYCIDEPELHMHSELQCRLMQEVNRIAPHGWQIWLATHSIGMVRWATQSLEAEPETVAFLDFHNRDFDHPVEIIPSIPNRSFWQSQFRVAIGELADLIVPRELFVCEGDNEEGFDANVLQAIFGNTHPDSAFQSVGSCRDVEKSGALLTSQLQRLTPGCKVRRLFDRDDRTEAEISECRAKGDRVLSVREIENYLFDFHVLEALVIQKGDLEQWEAVKQEIEAEIASLTTPARNKQSDDIKSAAPRIHQIMRSKLRLEQAGSKYTHFALEFLVPLIVPGTKIYAALENDLWPRTEC